MELTTKRTAMEVLFVVHLSAGNAVSLEANVVGVVPTTLKTASVRLSAGGSVSHFLGRPALITC